MKKKALNTICYACGKVRIDGQWHESEEHQKKGGAGLYTCCPACADAYARELVESVFEDSP